MLSSPRRLVRLGELASFQEGYVNPPQGEPSYFGSDHKWLRATDLNNGFVFDTSRWLSKRGFESAGKSAILFEPGTLAISKSGTIGRIGILMDFMCGNRAVINIKPGPHVDTRFLFYTLLLRRPHIETLAEGSVQRNLYISALSGVEIELPELDQQRVIASTLGALDDRIELLRQTNITLESIAQAILKSWFIDFDPVRAKAEGREPEGMDAATAALFPTEFEESALGLIPKGWRCARLGELLELAYGKALKATDRHSGSVPVYGSGGITGYHDEPLVHEGSVIVGRKGTVGSLYWENGPFYPIDTTFYVRPKLAPLTYCYYAMQRLGLDSMNTDAAVPGLNRENAYRRELVLPEPGALRAFDEMAMTLRSAINSNDMREKALAGLRDTLLPRLISGKLRIPEAQEQIEDALA